MTWSEYKKFVKDTSPDFKDESQLILATGISGEIGKLHYLQQDELINKITNTTFDPLLIVMKLGDICWYIASLENLFLLPDSIVSECLDKEGIVEVQAEPDEKFSVLYSLSTFTTELYKYILNPNILKLQYNLSEVFSYVVDFAYLNKIDFHQVINANVAKLKQRLEIGKRSHEQEYKTVKEYIKASGKKELLIEAILDVDNNYTGLRASIGIKKKVFKSKDIIQDFYNCTLFMYSLNSLNEEYNINYGLKFREYISSKKDYTFAYLKDGILISLEAIKKANKVKNNIIKIDSSTRPVLVNTTIKTFEDLLDYINSKKNE